jgi:hypothetical protein
MGASARVDHICKNTDESLRKMRALVIRQDIVFAKWYVEEFFMSGEHRERIDAGVTGRASRVA